MKKWTMLALATLVGLWLASGVAYAQEGKGNSEVKTAGNVRVEFITPDGGPVVGDSSITVRLRDASSGQPVVRDSVRVDLLMDEGDTSMSHGDMSKQEPVVVQLKAVKDTPGSYTGKADFSSAGNWKARVFVDPRGIQAPATFNLRVGSSGPNWLVIGGFVAVVALAIGAIVAMKRKAAPAPSATPAVEAGEA